MAEGRSLGNSEVVCDIRLAADPDAVDMPTAEAKSLTTLTVHGVLWNVVGTGLRHVAVLGSTVVVARLLEPRDYAVAGLATAFLGIFAAISAQGFATALVRETRLHEATCHSVFWLLSGVGAFLFAAVTVLSPMIAGFYGEPALYAVLPVLGGSLFMTLGASVPDALLTRRMQFRAKNGIRVVASVFGAGLAIGLAVSGFGYWALIVPAVGTAATFAVGSFWLSCYRPACVFYWTRLRSISRFGMSLLGASLLRYLSENADYLIMGRFWPKAVFGHYYFAFERSRQPFRLLSQQVGKVSYAAFTRVQDDSDRMRQAYLRGTRLLAAFTFPGYMLLIGLADPLVPWIFGQQWRPAVSIFQVFAAFCFVRTFGILVSPSLLALNCAHINLRFAAFRVAVTLPAILILGLSGAGVLTVSVVLVAIWIIQSPFLIGYLYIRVRLKWQDFWGAFGRLLLAAALMGITLAVVRVLAEMMLLDDGSMVLIAIVSSSSVFVLLAFPVFGEMLRLTRKALTS